MSRERRNDRVMVRMDQRELDMLRELAEADGGTMSEWVRRAVRKAHESLRRRQREVAP